MRGSDEFAHPESLVLLVLVQDCSVYFDMQLPLGRWCWLPACREHVCEHVSAHTGFFFSFFFLAAEVSPLVPLAPTGTHSGSAQLQSDWRQSGPAAAEEARRCLFTLQEMDSFWRNVMSHQEVEDLSHSRASWFRISFWEKKNQSCDLRMWLVFVYWLVVKSSWL